MDKDINDRNYNNFEDIGGKPTKRVIPVDSSGNLVNPATSDNQTNGSQKTQIVETIPTDSTKLNPSMVISITTQETATITTLTKTIGSDQYRKIISEDGSVISMSAWQKL